MFYSYKRIMMLLGLTCLIQVGAAQENERRLTADSVRQVDEVVVTSKNTFRETLPSQKLSGEALERLNTHGVADALRYFSGLQLKDYGGVGGLKTVNIRSMGTHHLGVFYDGIELGNAQNGQVDLGQFSLDNVEEITLYNGQKSAIFQPAADFGNAGSVYIRTRMPRFASDKSNHLRLRLKQASSDTYRFSTLWESRLRGGFCSSLNAEVLSSSGKYRFRYCRRNTDGTVAYDTTAIRQNGDIWAFRVEGNLYGLFSQGSWSVKAYSYNSGRGIPGAIVNNVWRRGERQNDHNHFTQARLQKSFGEQFSTQLLAKYAYYHTHYRNNDETQLLVNNTYRQQEAYVSVANVYEVRRNWSASLSYDLRWNQLRADVPQFVFPHRWSHLLALATAADCGRLKWQASLLGSLVKDHTRTLTEQKIIRTLTPALFVGFYPLMGRTFSLRAFTKKSFRMPTFNDLYYAEIGNARLQPETAIQYNIGCLLDQPLRHIFWKHLRLQTDVYYNTVHGKIVAYPKGQQFRWTMLNLGRVHITGVDAEGEIAVKPCSDLTLTTRLQYTYQQAQDVSSPSASYYRHQIPYIPWHSGSAIVTTTWKGWTLNYSFIYTGERYNQPENTAYNYMPAWYTSDLSLTCAFRWRTTRWKFTAEVNNLLNQDYDVILNYPMPQRNFGFSLDVNL